MKKATIMSILRDRISGADMISKNRSGNYVFRRGYFYTGGADEDKFADALAKRIADIGLTAKLIDKGNHWAPFKGGASIEKGSHFYAEFEII